MGNLKFNYLYRDAGNYKGWGCVCMRNTENLSAEFVTQILRLAFLEGCFFIADQVQIPELFPFGDGEATSDDHCFHEFDSVETTDEPPNDIQSRSVAQFVDEVEHQATRGWVAFDPHETDALGNRANRRPR